MRGLRSLNNRPVIAGAEMGQNEVYLEINGNKMVQGSLIPPSTLVTAVSDLGFIHGDTVRFQVFNADLNLSIFGPLDVPVTGLFNYQAKVTFDTGSLEGNYYVQATEVRPLFPDDVKAFAYIISSAAPPPPAPKAGFLGALTTLLVVGGVIVSVVALSPTINRGGKRLLGD